MEDKAKALALELAQDLDGELGGGVAAAMRDDNKTRDFGLSEAAAAAGLILAGVQIAMQYLSDKKMAALEAYLEANMPKPSKVTPAKRTSIIRKVLEKFSKSGG
jgi:mono/diheme cytochrome c family protein